MDATPFTDLSAIVHDLGDDRIWVYADWVRSHALAVICMCVMLRKQRCTLMVSACAM
jgi:hypothetical protein